jgi:hypothetical protein
MRWSRSKSFPQGLKPLILLADFGTTKVVPCQSRICAAGSWERADFSRRRAGFAALGKFD